MREWANKSGCRTWATGGNNITELRYVTIYEVILAMDNITFTSKRPQNNTYIM